VFENRVLRRMSGTKRDEVTEDWRELRNEKLQILLYSSNTIIIIKAIRMRWAGHIVRLEGRGSVYKILVGNLKVRTTKKT
jgi:hypothetical protein